MKQFSLAYSSCPNDTFIFHALAHKLLKADFNFNITIADVETLNKYAEKVRFDITKLSFATFGVLRDRYALLRSGAALGRGCGPLVVSLPQKQLNNSIKRPNVAVPGRGTTAFVLFYLFIKENFPEIEPNIIPMPFEKIMLTIKDGTADFGVIIHEGRFIYKNLGLDCLVDLGAWWEKFTGLPIPLGCIAIKRDIYQKNPKVASMIQKMVKESIDYAFDNPKISRDYIKAHAQELDDSVIDQHIELYVNQFSKNIGDEGEAAIKIFLQKLEEAELIAPNVEPLFVD
ncbi:MAG: 1,4-dihydroxy-6-naphthoate synthase [Desulfamplus sp.]|nr:1,4-dihydroxy-6-naphthoate synthase [Desulfamplus sp.]